MELKVWVEGIQRVICGVGEQTTCQDVVIALANATGKTGRFTLVERWRDNERLLAPSESPVQVLHKWGEYAMDVQFILRHSDSRMKSKKSRRTERLSDYSTHNGHAVKKSLTFSGGHSYSIFPPKTRPPLIRRPQDNSSLESLEDQHSVTSQSSRSTVSPYASFEGKPKANTLQGFPSRSPYGSFEKKNWAPSPRSTSSSSTPRGSFERRARKTSQSESLGSSPKSTEEYDLNKNIAKGKSTQLESESGIIIQNGDGHVHVRTTSSSSEASTTSKDELLKVMSQQIVKLNVQESQLNVLESEIVSWEQHDDVQQGKASATLHVDLEQLQATELEQSGELEELELVSWQDKLAIEGRQQQKLQAEIKQLCTKLEQSEAQLLSCRQKYQSTQGDLDSELERRRRDSSEQEAKVLQKISDLQKQISHNLVQHKESQSSIEAVQAEVKQLEAVILERKTQVADIETGLKEANLGTFTQVPSGWRPSAASGKVAPFNRSSSARPAIRRILPSPLQLKEIVATDRNPHGLWV